MLFAALIGLLAVPLKAQDGSRPSDEEVRKVQAAFLYKFYFYIRGLPSQLSERPYSIGVLGDDPFGEHLEAVEELQVDGRHVQLHRADEPAQLDDCDLIFIADSEEDRVEDLITHFQGKPQVLVSDMDGFAAKGGTVGFVLAEGRVGFEINQSTARASEIELSSHLLRLARAIWE